MHCKQSIAKKYDEYIFLNFLNNLGFYLSKVKSGTQYKVPIIFIVNIFKNLFKIYSIKF